MFYFQLIKFKFNKKHMEAAIWTYSWIKLSLQISKNPCKITEKSSFIAEDAD